MPPRTLERQISVKTAPNLFAVSKDTEWRTQSKRRGLVLNGQFFQQRRPTAIETGHMLGHRAHRHVGDAATTECARGREPRAERARSHFAESLGMYRSKRDSYLTTGMIVAVCIGWPGFVNSIRSLCVLCRPPRGQRLVCRGEEASAASCGWRSWRLWFVDRKGDCFGR